MWLECRIQGHVIERYENGEKDKDRLKEFELKISFCPGVLQKALSRSLLKFGFAFEKSIPSVW